MMEAFGQRGLNNISGIRMKSENGTQFICNTVENFLSMMNIYHERIHPATPKENGYKMYGNETKKLKPNKRILFIIVD